MKRLGKLLAALLVPLSIVPIVAATPRVMDEYHAFERRFLHREPLAPPDVTLTRAQLDRWCPLPEYRRAVPVLAYHGVNDRNDHYSVSRRAFAEQMAMLHAAGFHAIGIEEYVRFLHGEAVELPKRPILITFDDGRIDSYRGADRILARYGMRATMFVIAGAPGSSPFYMDWDELRHADESGRWDLEEHAGEGHTRIVTGPEGDLGPFYANRRFGGGALESFAAWQARVTEDIDDARERLENEIPGFEPHAFALPYGSFGQDQTNDPRIPSFLSTTLRERFAATFIVSPAAYTTPATPADRIGRYELHTETTTDELHTWLRGHLPAGAVVRTPGARRELQACGVTPLEPLARLGAGGRIGSSLRV